MSETASITERRTGGGAARSVTRFDVLIVGAGLSGVGAACRLATKCPRKSFAILEARAAIGGTWDLFRYPGVRSDSDMPTFGYPLPALGRCARDRRRAVDRALHPRDRRGIWGRSQVQFGCKVVRASWSAARRCWTLDVNRAGGEERVSLRFPLYCTGYYQYDDGYMPDWPGVSRFMAGASFIRSAGRRTCDTKASG